jgi:hypothetical protein
MNLGNLGRKTFAAPLAAFALVAGGGIALAASGGGVPSPEAAAHRPADAGRPTDTPTGKPTAEPTAESTDEPTDETSASPAPSLTGLCKAYRAGGYASSTKNGRANPAWSALEDAAGGSANIGSFCDARLGPAKVKPSHGPDDSDEPKADKPDKPAKAVKPPKADDDDADDDGVEVDSDDGGEGGSHGSEHGKH